MWLLSFLFTIIGLLIGGTIAWFFNGLQKNVYIIDGVCAGIILGLISFEIFPEAIDLGGWFSTIVGFTLGMILFEVLHLGLQNSLGKKGTSMKQSNVQTGILLMLSLSIHNVPLGIILGTIQETDVKMTLLQTLLFHSIPEGIILFTPLILSGTTIFNRFLVTCIVSIPVSVGVFIGAFFGWDNPTINTLLISLTMGILFMVTISEILYPALAKYSIMKVLIYTFIGLGMIGIYIKII